MLAVVDCNNFFVSCERVFQPKLCNKPVVTLSGYGGCVIARSQEAKDLGVQMCQPYFKIPQTTQKKLICLPGNHSLYSDMSARLMHLLSEAHQIQVYSVDEAFLNFSGLAHMDAIAEAIQLRQRILQQLGLPVSIGIAPTKTLAKLGSYLAKKTKVPVIYLSGIEDALKMDDIPLEAIWGIGKQTLRKLADLDIHRCRTFLHTPPAFLLKHFGVFAVRTQRELQGIACMSIAQDSEQNNTITATRTFKQVITTLWPLRNAVGRFCAIAAEKLRRQEGVCEALSLFIEGSRFSTHYAPLSATVNFSSPTCATIELAQKAEQLLTQLFHEGLQIKRAGITLYKIHSDAQQQLPAFVPEGVVALTSGVMDEVNRRFGQDAIYLANMGHPLQRSERASSPQYTRRWSDLMVVKA